MGRYPAIMVLGQTGRINELLAVLSEQSLADGHPDLAAHLPWQPGQTIAVGSKVMGLGMRCGDGTAGDRLNRHRLEIRLGDGPTPCDLSLYVGQRICLLELRAASDAAAARLLAQKHRANGFVHAMGSRAEAVCFADPYGDGWELIYPPGSEFQISWTLEDLQDYLIELPDAEPVLDVDQFGQILLELMTSYDGVASKAQILVHAQASARACVRLDLQQRVPAAGDRGGTWLGAWTHSPPLPDRCPQCGAGLTFAAQIDPSPLLGDAAGLWFLYLCDACLNEPQPSGGDAYALAHVPASQLAALDSTESTCRTSTLVAGAWGFVSEHGLTFPSVEDFFQRYFWNSNDGWPTASEERDYHDVVVGLDPRATLSDNGCYHHDRCFQIGGYAELCGNIGWNKLCPVCKQPMLLLFAAPNQPLVWAKWLENYVLLVWGCLAHTDQSDLLLCCMKFG